MKVQGYLHLGKISKPYGLQGELILALQSGTEEHITEGNPLFVELDGQRVPFFIEEAERNADRQAIVKLEFVDSLDEAKRMAGCSLYLLETATAKSETRSGDPASLNGYTAVDRTMGELGEISGFIPGEANPLWLIEYRGREIMVPASQDFIISIDHTDQSILLDLPEGISEL